MNAIHIFVGTKAQYIKTAPLLRLLRSRGIAHRLIDSGQHARLSARMRDELGIRQPDVVLGGADDIVSVAGAIAWAADISGRLRSARAVRREIFGDRGGVCVVHGDTPSTLLSALLARRAGLAVAHLEAGLRSHSLREPFPEEAVRVLVMRLSTRLFAPDAVAMDNLRAMGLGHRSVALDGNTVIEALRDVLGRTRPTGAGAVVTMHRVENLSSRRRVEGLVATVERLVTMMPVRFVLHAPTERTLRRMGLYRRVLVAGVELSPLVSHQAFVNTLAAARLVITDGGSVQEECALLGVPTLLWRSRTERSDGLGANVVLSGYDPQIVADVVTDPDRLRCARADLDRHPSELVLAELLAFMEGPTATVRRPARAG